MKATQLPEQMPDRSHYDQSGKDHGGILSTEEVFLALIGITVRYDSLKSG